MFSLELTFVGWEKNGTVLGNWTNQDDIVEEVVEGIVVAAKVIVNSRAGNDVIEGVDSFATSDTEFGIDNNGIIYTGSGNDTVSGSGFNLGIDNDGFIATGQDDDSILGGAFGTGIDNSSVIFTGNGNDRIEGGARGTGILNTGLISTGNGDDTLQGGAVGEAISNSGRLYTGNGNDSIFGNATGLGIANRGKLSTGRGNDIIEGRGVATSIHNTARIDTGQGNDIVKTLTTDFPSGDILAPGRFTGDGSIDLGRGDDLIIGFGSQKVEGDKGFDTAELGLPFNNEVSFGMSGQTINIVANNSTMSFTNVEKFVFTTGETFSLQQLKEIV
ncbi:MAG: calcium-binding protein [Leptolyngbyaceae cyanobacterium]